MKKYTVFLGVFLFSCLGAVQMLYAAGSKSVTIRSQASIKDTLELAISQAGQSELRFGNIVSAATPTQVGPLTVTVDVTSNTGQRYQVTQLLNGDLQNAANDKMPAENLKFTSSSVKAGGTVVTSPTPASASPQTIFVSDNAGTSDSINVVYTLTAPAFQAPGDYSALLTYTASAL